MDASFFIAKRLRFKGRIATACVAVSFLVMIIAVSVSSGFRHEIRSSLSSLSGDVMLTLPDRNVLDQTRPVEADPDYLPYVRELGSVEDVVPVVYRAGIVKHDDGMHGVLLKGLPGGAVSGDTTALAVSIPKRLAERASLEVGDRMLTYFIGERLNVRQFNVVSVYDAVVQTDDRFVVYASAADLQRLNGWTDGQVSAVEIMLKPSFRTEDGIRKATQQIGTIVNVYSSPDEESVVATSSLSAYPQLFSWLDLIDFNVLFILLLMVLVAGFNMISGLLIMLFENISTIGLLKSLGMTDRSIAKVFLGSSAVMAGKGMAIGNVIALSLCLLQGATHLLRLDPENYYVSFVPVHIDMGLILAADLAAFIMIMLFMLIPCVFISKVDPARTMRVK